jgi:hypothetical protein
MPRNRAESCSLARAEAKDQRQASLRRMWKTDIADTSSDCWSHASDP